MMSRMNLAYVAMAVLALLISDVAAARAAVQNCSVFPERCQYGSNGVYYFYPHGYRMPSTSESAAGAGAAGSARWGCGATDGTHKGRSWGYANRAGASYRALSECLKRGAPGSCRVVSCSPSVHSYYEAHATFFADR
jgi:hypothetical protein